MICTETSGSSACSSRLTRRFGNVSSESARRLLTIVRPERGGRVSVGELVDALGPRDRVSILLIPSLVALSPATVIFGVATICGMMITLMSAQVLFSHRSVWLPACLRAYTLQRNMLRNAVFRFDRALWWMERNTRPRLTVLVSRPLKPVLVGMSAVLGAALPFLELVPLSATLGGLAITLMILGVILRDGLIALAGILLWGCLAVLASKLAVSSVELIVSAWSAAMD